MKEKLIIPGQEKPVKEKLYPPGTAPAPTPKPKPFVSIAAPLLEYFRITKPYPKKRRLTKLKGLVVCPVEDALPDPHQPDIKVNLEITNWAVVLDGKIIHTSTEKGASLQWARKVKEITNGRIRFIE